MKYLFLLERLADSKIIKFLGAGVVNAVFGYSVYAALLFFSTPYLIALFVATIVGVIFNYFGFARLVFNEHGSWAVFLVYCSLYASVCDQCSFADFSKGLFSV